MPSREDPDDWHAQKIDRELRALNPPGIKNEIMINEAKTDFGDGDEMVMQCVEAIRCEQVASVSFLQRRFRLGYVRAARLIEEIERRGFIGPAKTNTFLHEVLIK